MTRIECNEAPASSVFWMMAVIIPLLGFAVIWIAGVPLRFDMNSRDFNPLVFIPVVAVAVGLFFMLGAVFMTLRLRRFGVSVLTLDVAPQVGGRLRGRVTSSVDVTASEWRLMLHCVETIKVAGSSTGSASQRTSIERWKFETTLPGEAYSVGQGVPVDIAIPEDALALRDPIERVRKKRGTLLWALALRGKRDGLDYLASFEIPMPRS
jgi:hypothetical protein